MFVEVYQLVGCNLHKIFDNRDSIEVRFYSQDEGGINIKLPGKLRLAGDFMLVFKHLGSYRFSPIELFRITFNTAFVGSDNALSFDRWSLSPENIQKEKSILTDDFKCQVLFSDYCKNS